MPATRRGPAAALAVAVLLAVAPAVHSAEAEEVAPRSWEEEEACAAGAGDCALSLRQLRAAGARAVALAPAAESESAPPAAEDISQGLPGGWGESSALGVELNLRSNNTMAGARARAMERASFRATSSTHLSGSCTEYGCSSTAVLTQGCQCHADCWWHYNCCDDYRPVCLADRNVITLYHQTSPEVGPLILENGFRPGKKGWCSGAIYFAVSAADTTKKAIGPDSQLGFIIEAEVDVGRVYELTPICKWNGNEAWLNSTGHDSIHFDPGDGPEYVIYNKTRVISTRIYIGG